MHIIILLIQLWEDMLLYVMATMKIQINFILIGETTVVTIICGVPSIA